ncbi:hypothetical protein SAMN05192588_0477 [Nonlabens sp. Hel1_33_55]|uniref:hypothetical protein n=1 Tax=Nonlabens sp. Hel1_33_55 TaxID=1336802 RepID=UPI000875C568|nr:hypothetical protein [Nonlabens sp. Hel1_33_55]SCX96669.1 hypothetical protein SAMN05192588_0477 [Nonlabens sp. Hel1_33_55]
MNKFILILAIIATISGVVGFTIDFAGTTFLRMLFLVTADIAVILLLGKFLFHSEKAKRIGQRIRVR